MNERLRICRRDVRKEGRQGQLEVGLNLYPTTIMSTRNLPLGGALSDFSERLLDFGRGGSMSRVRCWNCASRASDDEVLQFRKAVRTSFWYEEDFFR